MNLFTFPLFCCTMILSVIFVGHRVVRMRVNSASSQVGLSQVGLSQVGPGQLGPVISYIAYSFQVIPVLGVFYIYKCSAKV